MGDQLRVVKPGIAWFVYGWLRFGSSGRDGVRSGIPGSAFIPLAGALFFLLTVSPSRAGDELPRTRPALTLTADTPWVVAPDEPEPLQRALEDVKGDWYKVFGHVPVVLAEPPQKDTSGPVIYLGLKAPWLKEIAKENFPGPESYALHSCRDSAGRPAMVATGADPRGAIYAAYALSEEVLSVDPWYFWTDHQPAPRKSIALPVGFEKRAGPPTFKYRGWFINDEDLLSGFSPDPLRENIFSLEMWDHVCETLLRLHGNMLVPGTFTFPDERAQELAARRGLVLNMHHILTVGLNTYRWPKDVPFSYSKHPEIMERYWQACIDAFKKYEVVWTVGYRGKHDRPFWADEPEIDTPQKRGEAITKAIAKQVELIQKAQPGAPMIANLWMEGADLMRQGFLKIPAGVTIVWPDDGSGLIRDDGRVQAGQGIYYHTAMLNGHANQLSEMVNPGRIYDEVGRFARAGATAFFLVNVSDIRPVPLSTDCAMKFVWNAAPYLAKSNEQNMREFIADWCRRQFGERAAPRAARVYLDDYNIPYQRRTVRQGENALFSRVKKLDATAGARLRAGKPLDAKVTSETHAMLAFAAANRPCLERLLREAEDARAVIPEDRQPFYQAHLLTPVRIHLGALTLLEAYGRALDAWGRGDKTGAAAQARQAVAACESIADATHAAEYGRWARWYQGETFVGLEAVRDRMRAFEAFVTGRPAPPARTPRGYEGLYRYQEPFQRNFPLLYPGKP